jgi:hypothetical protein
LPTGGGPFAKDLAYALGFVRLLRTCHSAARSRTTDRLALVFCGKTALADLPLLACAVQAGLIRPPTIIPPLFDDPTRLIGRLAALPHTGHRLQRPLSLREAPVAPLGVPRWLGYPANKAMNPVISNEAAG